MLKDYHRICSDTILSDSNVLTVSRPRPGSCPWSSTCSRGCSGGRCSRAGPPEAWPAPAMSQLSQ